MSTLPKTPRIDLLLLTSFFGLVYFLFLGDRPLFVPDEGRYAEIAREMLSTGDYITPHLNGIKYFEKPVLFYWLSAAAIKLWGLNLWSLRSVNAIFSLIGCLATYYTAFQLYGRKIAILSACILGTSTLYFAMGHIINLDLPVTVLMTLCLYSLLLGSYFNKPHYFIYAAITAALALLVKGLIGVVLPAMIFLTWVMVTRQWTLFRLIPIIKCLIVFLLIALPWHYAVGKVNPEFYHFYIIDQHILRFATKAIGHYQPLWFFMPVLVVSLFPWIVFLPVGLWQSRRNTVNLFLFIWIIVIFSFFSLSQSKLIPYILPIFPPLAILIAQGIMSLSPKALRAHLLVLILLILGIYKLFHDFTSSTLLPDADSAAFFLHIASLSLLFSALLSVGLTVVRAVSLALISLIMGSSLFLVISLCALPAIDTRSIMPLASHLKPLLAPNDVVITYNQYYQDLPFYLERRVSILNWRNELTFGMNHQPDTNNWLINDDQFAKLWRSDQSVYVILANSEVPHLIADFPKQPYHILARTITNTLITNRA